MKKALKYAAIIVAAIAAFAIIRAGIITLF